MVGGEGITEALRAYLLRHFKSVVSSYGASDLEINIGSLSDAPYAGEVAAEIARLGEDVARAADTADARL